MIDTAFVLASRLAFKDGTARRPKMATNGNLFPVEPGAPQRSQGGGALPLAADTGQ